MIILNNCGPIRDLLFGQISRLYPLDQEDVDRIDSCLDRALERLEYCFSKIRNKYYSKNGAAIFDPLHGCQWSAFLYFLSNSIYRVSGGPVCDKIYGLLRMMSNADLFYQVELPDIFAFDHPLGSVIGRGRFSNYFTFSQGCTVGNNHGIYPAFGESVFMMSNSKVIGDCVIGDFVIIGANAYIKDADIPSGSLVFGQSPDLVIKEGHLMQVQKHAEEVFIYN